MRQLYQNHFFFHQKNNQEIAKHIVLQEHIDVTPYIGAATSMKSPPRRPNDTNLKPET